LAVAGQSETEVFECPAEKIFSGPEAYGE